MQSHLRKLPAAWPLVIFLLFAVPARTETAMQAWFRRYIGPGTGNDYFHGLAVDHSNNVVVAGESSNGTDADFLTVRYSSAGVPLWTNRYDGGAGDSAVVVAVDGSNNVLVAGYSYESGSGNDYLTIKYSSAGELLWARRYNGPGNGTDHATAMAVDSSNNVIVTGISYDSAHFSSSYATVKYSSAGVAQWTNRYDGTAGGFDYAHAVAVDGSNNVIVTGQSDGVGSSYDYATIKYSSAGVAQWTNRYTGSGYHTDCASAVAADHSNNVIVTGYSRGEGTGDDYLTIKYSDGGTPLWTNRYTGLYSNTDYATAVAVDRSNNVIVTGFSYISPFYACITIKYSSAGVPVWTSRYGWGHAALAHALALDGNDDIIIAGAESVRGWDFVTVKYVCVPEPVLSGRLLSNGAFQVRVDEVLQPGTLVIEAATNLSGWAPVFTNTTPTNVVFYTEPEASNEPTRFYRAFQFP